MQNSKCRMQNEKNELVVMSYIAPELEVIKLENEDIITTSPGTETTPKEDNDGIWDFDLG
ncbi:MAG: hypothetical protein IJD79_00190 [Clostridia bacterium]|nr:hypothetical protein [Clostridia bacterium]